MKNNSKGGAASIFVVIFTTLLLSIISLGFVSIMISEANQTINFDLSQSAYDSALAGVEDAKIALLKYHECLNRGATATSGSTDCRSAVSAMTTNYSKENCDIVSDMLDRPHIPNTETIVQSESNYVEGGTEVLEQAYTCVRMEEETVDYLGTLNQNYRTKVIPIRTSQNVDDVAKVRLEWYNTEDNDKVIASSDGAFRTGLANSGHNSNKEGFSPNPTYSATSIFGGIPIAPPTMQFNFIQTASSFRLEDFETNKGANSNRGGLLLRPSQNGTNSISNSQSNGLAASADESFNNPVDVRCNMGSDSYRCSVEIELPKPVLSTNRNDGTTFVRLVLPYNSPDTSFSIELLDSAGKVVNFAGVQTKVDSTGRANDLFRRIESRIEMVDIYYPYPEFTADIQSESTDSIWKNFWVTYNCWTTNPGVTNPPNSASAGTCPNVAELSADNILLSD